MEIVMLVVGLIIGLLLGVLLGWMLGIGKLQAALATSAQLREQLDQAREERRLDAERASAERAEREARATETHTVLEKLAPVDKVITELKTKVEQMEQARTEQHAELRTQLRTSFELSAELSKTTQSLSRVMSDNSLRGTWGELQLARIAELSGLRDGIDYELQETIAGDDGRGRPDMIVKLPGGTFIAVDAKAPFTAYNEAMALDDASANSLENRKSLLAKHARDLRGHINTLASREYAKHLPGAVDYVVCFVPADSILVAALDADHDLLEYALSKKVVLASPSSLVAVLRPVAITWAQVENAERASEIVEMGKELYKRLSKMAGFAAALGGSIQTTAKRYNEFVSSLEARVLPQARKFDSISAEDLPEIDTIDGTINLFRTAELRGLNAALDEPQTAIGEPIDAVAVAEIEPVESNEV